MAGRLGALACPRCWAASLDAAKCRAAARWQRPPRGEAELVALPCGATLRVLLTEAAGEEASSSRKRLPTLLMAPDPPNTLETHAALTAALAARGVRTLTFELPGFDFSTPPAGFACTPDALAAVADELLRWLERLDGAPCRVVLALSCVAGLAARPLAARRRDVVAGIISLQTPAPAEAAAWATRADRLGVLRVPLAGQLAMLTLHGKVIDSWYRAALAKGRADPLRAPLEAAAHAARAAGAHNCLATAFQAIGHVHGAPVDEEPALACPALVLWGGADRTHAATDKCSALMGLAGAVRFVELAEAGHFPELEATGAFVDQVVAFLTQIASAGTGAVSKL
jgi:pimeloyl-ACP methyl ester carboxylesterase